MLKLFKSYWIYLFSFIFIALNSYLISQEFYYFSLLPFALALISMAFFNLEKLMLFIVFCTPLSINLEEMELGGIGMYLPTEPLMFGVMLLFFLKLIYEQNFDSRIIKHPVTIAILFNIFWLIITAITSELPVVSFKFVVARMWFVVCFYFIATQLFVKTHNLKRFFWLYLIPLTIVIFYTVIRHAFYGFEEKPAHWVMSPFYKDHTSYGAILAMFYPILFLFLHKRYAIFIRLFVIFLIAIFTLAIVLSYTRAAWVSLAIALVLYLIYHFRIKFQVLMFATLAVGFVLAINFNTIVMKLEKNDQDSSDELSEHVQSISNISTDASNVERINRWTSAWLMFQERPFLGWGPGTYVFTYAPFQLSSNKTIISTNAGDNGNAHSEYIGPLSESGVLGMLSFVTIIIIVYWRGSRLYHSLPKGELKSIVLVSLLGLITYVAHGFLNNYLDTDKASVPFWGFIAIVVAIDVYKKELLESYSQNS